MITPSNHDAGSVDRGAIINRLEVWTRGRTDDLEGKSWPAYSRVPHTHDMIHTYLFVEILGAAGIDRGSGDEEV